jgi:hydrogenase maturation protease
MLIGFGNPLRRDDGAGPALAKMVEEWGGSNDVKVLTPHQLVPELAEDLAETGVMAVMFLDACANNSKDAEMVEIRLVGCGSSAPAFGHIFSPVDLLQYTELLRGVPLPAWQVTLPGIDFGYGEGLSGYCAKNVAVAFEMLQVFLLSNPPQW